MFIKVQEHYGSNEFQIINNVKDVTYANEPYWVYSHNELKNFSPQRGSRMSLWLTQECVAPYAGGKEAPAFKFDGEAYRLNVIHYTDEDDLTWTMIFDGTAYICEGGNTIHKLREAGPTPVPNPINEL